MGGVSTAPRRQRPRRVTIREIAADLGLSHAAVSYALNGQDGVSDETRQRILAVARAKGWQPSVAARAMTGHGIGSVGLVLARDAAELAEDGFYLPFIAGMQRVLFEHGYTLTFQVVPSLADECEVYRSWAAQERVDGVIVVDIRLQDPRIDLLTTLGTPSVLVGAREHVAARAPNIAVVWADDDGPMTQAVTALTELGHRRIGHICGPAELTHTARRAEAFTSTLRDRALTAPAPAHTNYSTAAGTRAAAALRARSQVTALICDNDRLAVGALQYARQTGLRVPAELSIVSWEDSALCAATTPALAALRREPFALGEQAADTLLAEIIDHVVTVIDVPPATLIRRESIGPPEVDQH